MSHATSEAMQNQPQTPAAYVRPGTGLIISSTRTPEAPATNKQALAPINEALIPSRALVPVDEDSHSDSSEDYQSDSDNSDKEPSDPDAKDPFPNDGPEKITKATADLNNVTRDFKRFKVRDPKLLDMIKNTGNVLCMVCKCSFVPQHVRTRKCGCSVCKHCDSPKCKSCKQCPRPGCTNRVPIRSHYSCTKCKNLIRQQIDEQYIGPTRQQLEELSILKKVEAKKAKTAIAAFKQLNSYDADLSKDNREGSLRISQDITKILQPHINNDAKRPPQA